MFENILSYLKFGNQFCGIEHGKDSIAITLVKKARQKIDFENAIKVSSIEDLDGKLPKRQHVFLVINNENVLTKKVDSNQLDDLKLVNKAFPNLNINDFYYEVLNFENNHFVFICRKEYVDNLIEQYSKLNISIINVSLGNALVPSIRGFINSDSIQTSNNLLQFNDGVLTGVENMVSGDLRDYDINGLKVSSHQLLSFAGALNVVIPNQETSSNFETKTQFLKEEYNHKRFFNQFLKFALSFIFGMLFINFFVFNKYFNKVNDLQQLSQVNRSSKGKFLSLKEKVDKTEKMVSDILKNNASKSSFYVNNIIQSIPNSVLLSELDFQPLTKNIKSEQEIEIEKHSIIVSGQSNNSELYSQWIATLENKSWVSSIDLMDYTSTTKSISNFTIRIKFKDE